MNTAKESSVLKLRSWVKQSLFLKVSNICLIIGLLMIPNALIKEW